MRVVAGVAVMLSLVVSASTLLAQTPVRISDQPPTAQPGVTQPLLRCSPDVESSGVPNARGVDHLPGADEEASVASGHHAARCR